MQMLQIFNEVVSLVHVQILDGVKKKNKFEMFVHELQYITYHYANVYFWGNFLKLNRKKKSQLICFIEITSILAMQNAA